MRTHAMSIDQSKGFSNFLHDLFISRWGWLNSATRYIFDSLCKKKIKGIIQFLQFDVLKKQWNLG